LYVFWDDEKGTERRCSAPAQMKKKAQFTQELSFIDFMKNKRWRLNKNLKTTLPITSLQEDLLIDT
jgi:hypothetical protein